MRSRGIKIAFTGIIVLAALSAAVMLLWNLVVRGIFGLASINFWQALGLLLLTRILFGRLGFGANRMMMHGRGNPIHEKWMKMTPEQRKEFINKRRQSGFRYPFGMEGFDMKEHEEGEGDK